MATAEEDREASKFPRPLDEKAYWGERSILNQIAMEAKRQKIKKTDLAKMAFPEKDAPRRLNAMLKYARPEDPKPQVVSVRDYIKLCEVLNLDWPQVAWSAKQHLNELDGDYSRLERIHIPNKYPKEDKKKHG